MIKFIEHIGRYFIMLQKMLEKFTKFDVLWRLILREIDDLIIGSLGIVSLISFFVGGVVAIQTAINMENPLLPRYLVGFATRQTMILEFAPTFISIIMAGKVGSFITSSIGTMRVTEQIDALKTLNTNYYNYLVTPRVLSLTLALPIFVTLVDFIGVMGGYLVSVHRLGFNDNLYLLNTIDFLSLADYLSGIFKAVTFGFIISIVSCYCGLFSDKGAFGVGSATTNAVVISSILILSSNYFLTELFF